MIFRISKKLATKIKITAARSLPVDPNPFADWSAHLFSAQRTQYVILTNSASLYSTVMYGRGIANGSQFFDRAWSCLREFLVADGLEFIFSRFIAPETETVRFSIALNRSITGSMNDFVYHAKMWLIDGNLSPFDVSFKLNEIPMSYLDYANPREVFKLLKNGS